ncbi:hypothetical protein DXG03_006483 [Asterophora parasitica]|uniref:Uncharacterized protein n=1 Tax=Asterophora parasitica TaxID=117018 RepID=A0A9P7G7H7_9AGAR|nr:hypothetical protein DXG03_006483 [Asterophora parasitica]
MNSLQFPPEYWTAQLGGMERASLTTKLHLVFSLMIFLGVSIQQLLQFIFSSDIRSVKDRSSRFMGYTESATLENRFYPSNIFHLWHTRWPAARRYLHEMIIPCAHEIVLEESDQIIADRSLQVQIKDLTVSTLRQLLHPHVLIEKYQELAPFTFKILHTFSASPNKHRKEKASKRAQNSHETSDNEDYDLPDDPNMCFDESGAAGRAEGETGDGDWWKGMPGGFARNPIYAIVLTISILAFVRNRATNVLPLLLGLFFKISGTSNRVVVMLSNAGVCVSGRTIERLKETISKDAIDLAIQLMTSGKPFFVIFDNINLYLRKFQQRVTNQNTMIHATNSAVVALTDVDISAENLTDKLERRGRRFRAEPADMLPS